MFLVLPYHTDRIIMHLFLRTNTLTPLVCLSLLAHSVFLLQFGLQGRVKEVLLQSLNISYSKCLLLRLKIKSCKSIFLSLLKIPGFVKICPSLGWLPGCWCGPLCKRGLQLYQWVACALADKQLNDS